jgi:hypothetical protein
VGKTVSDFVIYDAQKSARAGAASQCGSGVAMNDPASAQQHW